jgi:fimbrial chaperone protein
LRIRQFCLNARNRLFSRSMTRKTSLLLALLLAPLLTAGSASSAQLRVEPVLLELNAPAAAGTLTLLNGEDNEATIQTQVFKWSQSGGVESLEPTTDVVASPPAVKLAPHTDNVVRIVRITKQPVQGEESYRVILTPLPRMSGKQAPAVNLVIRQSIPVFFRGRELTTAQVSWEIRSKGGELTVTAGNAGEERLRIANLQLTDSKGKAVSFGGNGLNGYVLGRSSMSWVPPKPPPSGFGSGGPIIVTADTDKGQVHAVVDAPARR